MTADQPGATATATGAQTQASGRDGAPDQVSCSFCLKPAAEVAKVVAGPGVFICNECVGLAQELIATVPGPTEPATVAAWEANQSDEDLLATLPKIAAAGAQVEHRLALQVRRARSRGITWTRIGTALGMTRQSAWERFSGEE
jgi:ClpX C4-type zinc finger